jgi:hypothetical protein
MAQVCFPSKTIKCEKDLVVGENSACFDGGFVSPVSSDGGIPGVLPTCHVSVTAKCIEAYTTPSQC